MKTDAELIEVQKNKRHAGRDHRVVVTSAGRAVEFTDQFGQRVMVLAKHLVWGER